ncbi:MFS transporter [Bacillus sp. EB600]|uniref:MFS transporter n=1 Tax=Bacillus sp. EB600 TaxID=2806345 RepID=UPI00210E5CD3|nr:MFS transporter [Bacillus sp. EB600]MCQ6279183.1 MFS transporter [Bacillus sp. EB600]
MKKNRALFLTAVASGTMLNPLNSSMISLALHSIQKDFHLSFTTVSWLISSFYLASAVAQPVTGKIGDLIGSKKTFLIGLLLVAISAFGAPLSSSFFMLIIMRLIQAIGSSAIYPSGVTLIKNHIHDRQASALAVLAIFASAMTSLGPTVGGFLIVWGDWPAIFRINFPFLIIGFLLGWFLFPKDQKKEKTHFKDILSHIDVIGISLFTVGIVFLLWFLLSIKTTIHLTSGIAGILFLALFVWRELTTKEPFIDIRLFRSLPNLSWVYLQFICLNIFFYCLFFGLPSYFQDEMHYSVKASGLFMLFMSGASVLISPITGKWVDKTGVKQPITAGSFLLMAGAVVFTLYFVHAPFLGMGFIMLILGVSYGILNVVLQAAMVKESPSGMIGTTSGLFQTCRYFGSILSSIVLGLVFGKTFTESHMHFLGFILIIFGSISFLMGFWFTSRLGNKAKIVYR